MAVLPDVTDLGRRPIPQSRRQPVTVRNAEAVGEAVSQLGAAGSQVLTRIEEIRDEDNVRRLDVEHAAEARRIRQTAREARGLNAQEARTKAEADLTALDERIIRSARSSTARNALATMVSRRSSLERDNVSEYAQRETTQAMDEAITARIETATIEAEENWDNSEAMEAALVTATTELGNRGQWRGDDPAITARAQFDVVSRARSAVVEGLIQREDYEGAAAYLDEYREQIGREQERGLRTLVNGQLRVQQQRVDGAWAITEEAESDAPPQIAPEASQGRQAGREDAPEEAPAFRPAPNGVRRTAGPAPFSAVKQRIIANEAGPQVGGYDAIAYNTAPNRNAAGVVSPRPLTQMTMGEVHDFQLNVMRPRTRRRRGPDDVGSTGVGAYQFESGTLRENAQQVFGANWRNVPFTAQNQDRVAEHLYNRVRNNPTLLANTWAAFGSARGREPAPPPRDGTRIDVDRAYARIDAQPWSDARKERAREEVRRIAGENDQVRVRIEQDADAEVDAAVARIVGAGGRVTDISQLPAGAVARSSPSQRRQIQEYIANNNRREVEANSPLWGSLISMGGSNDPRKIREFMAQNPELYRGRISDSEVIQMTQMQNQIRNRDGVQPSQIMGMINFVLPETGLIPSNARDQRQGGETEAQARGRIADTARTQIFSGVQTRLARNFPPGTQPTEQDILDAVRAETTIITIDGQQMRLYDARRRYPGIESGGRQNFNINIPGPALPSIDAVLRASGRPVNGPERIAEYLRHKSRYDAR